MGLSKAHLDVTLSFLLLCILAASPPAHHNTLHPHLSIRSGPFDLWLLFLLPGDFVQRQKKKGALLRVARSEQYVMASLTRLRLLGPAAAHHWRTTKEDLLCTFFFLFFFVFFSFLPHGFCSFFSTVFFTLDLAMYVVL